MNNKAKTITGVSLVLAVLIVAILNSLGLFTSRTNVDHTVKVGTLDIEVVANPGSLSNSDLITPGNNDPRVEVENKGASHELTFKVNNLGNKAVRTRHTIILSANNGDEVLDASLLRLLKFGKEIEKVSYIDIDGNEFSDASTSDVASIKYVYLSDDLDGVGEGAEVRDESNVVSSKEYKHDFALLLEADNKFQGANISFEIIVEAIQYFNTDASTWTSVSTVRGEYAKNSVKLNTVPAANEDSSGNEI